MKILLSLLILFSFSFTVFADTVPMPPSGDYGVSVSWEGGASCSYGASRTAYSSTKVAPVIAYGSDTLTQGSLSAAQAFGTNFKMSFHLAGVNAGTGWYQHTIVLNSSFPIGSIAFLSCDSPYWVFSNLSYNCMGTAGNYVTTIIVAVNHGIASGSSSGNRLPGSNATFGFSCPPVGVGSTTSAYPCSTPSRMCIASQSVVSISSAPVGDSSNGFALLGDKISSAFSSLENKLETVRSSIVSAINSAKNAIVSALGSLSIGGGNGSPVGADSVSYLSRITLFGVTNGSPNLTSALQYIDVGQTMSFTNRDFYLDFKFTDPLIISSSGTVSFIFAVNSVLNVVPVVNVEGYSPSINVDSVELNWLNASAYVLTCHVSVDVPVSLFSIGFRFTASGSNSIGVSFASFSQSVSFISDSSLGGNDRWDAVLNSLLDPIDPSTPDLTDYFSSLHYSSSSLSDKMDLFFVDLDDSHVEPGTFFTLLTTGFVQFTTIFNLLEQYFPLWSALILVFTLCGTTIFVLKSDPRKE